MHAIKEFVAATGYQSLYILTCADGRVHPEEIFGLKKGDANVIRNAGGRAIESDVFRSFGVMSSIAPIGLIVVLHHTGTFLHLDFRLQVILTSPRVD